MGVSYFIVLCIGVFAIEANLNYCGDLEYVKDIPKGTDYCARLKPVGFYTCKLLLLNSTKCNALVYYKGRCTIFQRSEIGGLSSIHSNMPSIKMLKLTKYVDSCIIRDAENHYKLSLASSRLSTDDSAVWNQLPALGLVMTVTKDWMGANQNEVEAVVSNFQCYASVHDYKFHLHVMESTPRSKFYHIRHLSAAKTYLHRYKYLLMLDADNFVFNLSRPLDDIIFPSTSQSGLEPPHIILHMRDGGEVTASTFLIRNSALTWQFLEMWREMAPPLHLQSPDPSKWIETPNHDNGDLVALLMLLMDEETYLKCVSQIPPSPLSVPTMQAYDRGVLLCFRLFRGAFAAENQRVAAGIAKRLPYVHIYFTRESFFTMHTGHLPATEHTASSEHSITDKLFSTVPQIGGQGHIYKDVTCAPSDIIGHGLKNIGTTYWGGHVETCEREKILKGQGANRVCRWLSKSEELLIARHYCFWRSPVCWDSANGRNICMHEFNASKIGFTGANSAETSSSFGSKCEIERFNLQRYSLCEKYDICNPLLTFRQYHKNITGLRHTTHLGLSAE